MNNINLGVWESFKNEIRHHLNTDNINNFINWQILRNTMIAGVDNIEFDYLSNSISWSIWEEKLNEDKLKPNSYHRFPNSSTNNVHHAYSLQRLMDYSGLKLNEFGTIIEFGGGYGNTSRLFKKWGHNNDYYIYDIEELTIIQNHYLNTNEILDVKIITDSTKVLNVARNPLEYK